MEVIETKEKAMLNFQQTQYEKKLYLGEFKENVIIALNKKDISLKIEKNFIEKMKLKNASLLKINRDVELKKVKKYIEYAENINLNYRLVDDVTFEGDIGMLIVSNEALDNKDIDVILKTNKKKHVKKKNKFKKNNFWNKLIQIICPICAKEKRNEGE